jgi:hypothetical protein
MVRRMILMKNKLNHSLARGEERFCRCQYRFDYHVDRRESKAYNAVIEETVGEWYIVEVGSVISGSITISMSENSANCKMMTSSMKMSRWRYESKQICIDEDEETRTWTDTHGYRPMCIYLLCMIEKREEKRRRETMSYDCLRIAHQQSSSEEMELRRLKWEHDVCLRKYSHHIAFHWRE